MSMSANTNHLSNAGQEILALITSQLNQGSIEVPLLPEVASRTIQLTQNPDSDAAELARLIQSDPTLAAQVMRTANSAAYTPNASMVSLQQAIARLGMNLISDIAVAASINTRMFHAPGFEELIAEIWKHALATAIWGKEIARSCRLNVETSFLCGLLHSIGKPVTLQAACDIAKKNNIELTTEDAKLLLNLAHREVGSCVLKNWGMPTIICEVLEFFDDYANAPSANTPACITHAASLFATHMLNQESLSEEQLSQSEVLADLNLYADDIETLLEKHDSIISAMEVLSA